MRWIKFLGWVAALAAVGIAALTACPALRDYLYREGSYAVLLKRVASAERDPVRLTRQTVRAVHEILYPGGGPVIDTDAWTDLVRGIGWCDQQDWVVGTLLALRGVRGRLVMLDDESGVSGHTVMEAYLNGDWRVVDPLYGLMFTRPDGALATREDLSRDLTPLAQHPIVQQMAPVAREQVMKQYAALFPLRMEPTVWSSVLDSRSVSRPKAWLARAAQRAWTLGGPAWSAALQDLYFLWPVSLDQLSKDMARERTDRTSTREIRRAYRWYVRARNYHLYGRYRKAAAWYQRVIAAYPQLSVADRSAAWLGLAQLDAGDRTAALHTFQQFLRDRPDDGWRSRVLDGLARADEGQAARQPASDIVAQALEDPYIPTAQRLADHLSAGDRPFSVR